MPLAGEMCGDMVLLLLFFFFFQDDAFQFESDYSSQPLFIFLLCAESAQ